MKTINDGGRAFPVPHTVADANSDAFKAGWPGMSLRDYFAGQVLAGAASTFTGLGEVSKEERTGPLLQAAGIMYEIADAMIAAREAKQ